VSVEGRLYNGLFVSDGTDLRALLRSVADDRDISLELGGLWNKSGDNYSELTALALGDLKHIKESHIGRLLARSGARGALRRRSTRRAPSSNP